MYAAPASRGSGRAMAAAHWAHRCSRAAGAASDSQRVPSYILKAAARAQLPQRSANVITYPGNARCAQLLSRVPQPSTAAGPPPAARREASHVSCPPSAGRPPIPTQPRKHSAPIKMRSIAWPVPNRLERVPQPRCWTPAFRRHLRRNRCRRAAHPQNSKRRGRKKLRLLAASPEESMKSIYAFTVRDQRPVPAEERRTCNRKRSAGNMGWSAPARCSEKVQAQYTIRMLPLFTVHCWSTGPDDWCGKQSTGESVPVRWKAPTVPPLPASAVTSAPAVNNRFTEAYRTGGSHLSINASSPRTAVRRRDRVCRADSDARDGNERELAASWHVRDGPALTASDGWFIQRRALDEHAIIDAAGDRSRNEVPPPSASRQFPGLGYWT